MRRFIVLLTIALAATAMAVAPAGANPPTEFTTGFTLFDEPDPCYPGETHDVTFTFHIQEQANRNTTVWVVDSYAETTRGYVAFGTETQVVNKNWIIDHFNWQNVHPETGDRWRSCAAPANDALGRSARQEPRMSSVYLLWDSARRRSPGDSSPGLSHTPLGTAHRPRSCIRPARKTYC